MRVKDLKAGLPMLPPSYVVLDAKSFVFESKYTDEYLMKPYAERTLALLSTSYNYISLFEKKEESIINKLKDVFKTEKNIPYLGKRVDLPIGEWKGLLEEYDTILLYYGDGSDQLIFQNIPVNRRLKYSPDPVILDTVIANYRIQHQIKKPIDREQLNKIKRSKQEPRFRIDKITKFEEKFYN